ncbi:MAG: hypothetical protein V1827_02990 [Candidatus Micrarchaeota archaeon]
MKNALMVSALLLLSVCSFAITASDYENRAYCYEAMQDEASRLKSLNNGQDLDSGSLYVSYWGCVGTCADRLDMCEVESNTAYQSCVAAANVDGMTGAEGTACIKASNQRSLTCANYEIDCCMIDEKTKCDTLPSSQQGEIDCVDEWGGYATDYYGECTCIEGAFKNEYIHQCVPNTVYGSCDERNAEYDPQTDSCVCFEGYYVSGDACVSGDGTSGGNGGSIGRPDSDGTQGSGTTGSSGGCSSAAILLLLGGLDFVSRR